MAACGGVLSVAHTARLAGNGLTRRAQSAAMDPFFDWNIGHNTASISDDAQE
jgi:hypothetical protein